MFPQDIKLIIYNVVVPASSTNRVQDLMLYSFILNRYVFNITIYNNTTLFYKI